MTTTTHVFDHSLVIRFKGDFDYSISPVLEQSLQLAYRLSVCSVIFNLKEVTSVESAGLGSFCFALNTLRRNGIEGRLVDPPGQIRDLINQSEWHDKIFIYDTEVEARKVA